MGVRNEEEGVLVSRSGAKSYANVDSGTVERIRRELLTEDTKAWVTAMKPLEIFRRSEQLPSSGD